MKKVLVTGGSGFLGKVIVNKLKSSGCLVMSLGRSSENDIVADISAEFLGISENFDTVIHAAGLAHIMQPIKVAQKNIFYDINVNGTKNLLQSLESSVLPSSFIFISTVAVYGINSGSLINEDQPLRAIDPYGASKIEAEQIISTWCFKNDIVCTILRLPLVAGKNPPGNLSSMINGIKLGRYFNIEGGNSKKSMVLAEDVASLVSSLQLREGIFNLTDGIHPRICEIAKCISRQLSRPDPKSIPLSLALIFAFLGDFIGIKSPFNSNKLNKLITDLTFDDTKARVMLDWKPNSVIDNFQI